MLLGSTHTFIVCAQPFGYIGEDMELHHGLLGGVRVLLLHILKVDLDLMRYNVIDNMCITVIQSSKQPFYCMVLLHRKGMSGFICGKSKIREYFRNISSARFCFGPKQDSINSQAAPTRKDCPPALVRP